MIFTCTKCTYKSNLKASLEKHFLYVHFYCMRCKDTQTNRAKIIEHLKAKHPKNPSLWRGEEKVLCKYCSKEVSMKPDHVLTKHLACWICDKEFKVKTAVIDHIKLEHPSISVKRFEETYECKLCPYINKDAKKGLRRHCRTIHFYCLDCDIKYETMDEILDHSKKMHNFVPPPIKEYETRKCDICGNGQFRFSAMKIHMLYKHFHCFECEKDFKGHAETLKHLKQVHPKKSTKFMEKTFLCSFCPISSKSKGVLDEHLMTIHSFCPSCQVDLKRNEDLFDHMKEMHKEEYRCDMCNKRFVSKHSLGQHSRKSHSAFGFYCGTCGHRAITLPSLEDHKNAVHLNKKQFKCDQCDYETAWKTAMKDHILSQHPAKDAEVLQCDQCSFTTNVRHFMRRHVLRIHISNKPLPCDICGKMITTKGLSKHMREIHGKSGNEIQCDKCEYKSNTERNLKRHIRNIHRDKKLEECLICQRMVLNLKLHIKNTHRRENKFQCDQCEYKTYTGNLLEIHFSHMHSDNAFECEVCNSKFATKSALNWHVKRIHKVSEGFKCEDCDFITKSKSYLKRHVDNLHLQIHKYCDICDYKTYDRNSFESHVRKHLPLEQRLKCKDCSFKTHRRSYILQHEKRLHTESMQCEKCSFHAISRDEYWQHIRGIHKSKHRCEKCEKEFTTVSGHTRHLKESHLIVI